jgi:hypothetical protein
MGVRAEERDEGSSTTGIGRRVFVFIGDEEVPACCETDLARVFRGVSGILLADLRIRKLSESPVVR